VARVVLVVDDEPDVLDVMAGMFEDLGCEVVTASSADRALEKLASDPRITLLFADVNMPELDGYALAEQAKRLRPRLQVILTSGRPQARDEYALLRKPFDSEQLSRAMADTSGLC
jgi:CheY-like chemotaxis protein